MKKIFKLLGISFMMILLSGCVKSNVTMKINSDKSMDYTMTVGVSKEVQELAKSYGSSEQADVSSMFSDKDKEQAEKNGFTVKEFNDDKFSGYSITKHFNNIDELSGDKDYDVNLNLTNEGEIKIFKEEKGFLSNTYKAKIKFDDAKNLNESMKQYNSDEYESYKKYMEGMDISFNVELPGGVGANNATSVDGNKLTWDFTKFDKDAIEFEFKTTNTSNLIIVIVGACAVVAIVIGVIVLVTKKKEKTTK